MFVGVAVSRSRFLVLDDSDLLAAASSLDELSLDELRDLDYALCQRIDARVRYSVETYAVSADRAAAAFHSDHPEWAEVGDDLEFAIDRLEEQARHAEYLRDFRGGW